MRSVPVGKNPPRIATAKEARPSRWALSPPARWFRALTHWWFVRRHVRKYCRPLTVSGAENLGPLKGPAIFVANHTSHFDAFLVSSALPPQWRNLSAMAAAADRWFTQKRWKALWLTLLLNIYPIQRGGGRGALNYSQQLLSEGWSLIIFPEGTRAKRGHMEGFKFGVAILALAQNVPVVPIYIEGGANLLPPGERRLRAASVGVRIGRSIAFAPGTTVPEATELMRGALERIAGIHSDEQAAAPVAAA